MPPCRELSKVSNWPIRQILNGDCSRRIFTRNNLLLYRATVIKWCLFANSRGLLYTGLCKGYITKGCVTWIAMATMPSCLVCCCHRVNCIINQYLQYTYLQYIYTHENKGSVAMEITKGFCTCHYMPPLGERSPLRVVVSTKKHIGGIVVGVHWFILLVRVDWSVEDASSSVVAMAYPFLSAEG